MQILIIGVSSIVTRRVLPALVCLSEVEKIHLASLRPPAPPETIPGEKLGHVIQGYSEALSKIEPCVAYVSLPNSLHAEWVRRALRAGFHVIVDKPAFISLAETEELLELANKCSLCIAEATVWNHHPQIELIKNLFYETGLTVTHLSATFSFPPFEPTNFRWQPHLGGGSLLDLGPYAASCSRIFLEEPPIEIVCRINSRSERSGVDTSFCLLARYEDGRSMVGQFGFNTEYRNSVSLLGTGIFVEVDRVFTMPPDSCNQLKVRRANNVSIVAAPPGDSFQVFLRRVLSSIQKVSWSDLTETMLQDAQLLHRMRGCTS